MRRACISEVHGHGLRLRTSQRLLCRAASTQAGSSSSPSIQAAGPSSKRVNGSSSGTSSTAASSTASSTSPKSQPSAAAPPPSSTSSLSRRKNTDLALIVSGALGLSALVFYNLRPQVNPPPSSLSKLSPSSRSFTLPVASSSGTQLRTITMMPTSSVNSLLGKNERSYSITRPGNPLYRYDTNSVASNETCEDAHAFTILEHEGNDWILTSMFDGHAGYATSRLMAEQLEKYIGRELMEVLQGGYKSLSVTSEGWWNWLWTASKGKTEAATQNSANANGTAGPNVQVNERIRLIPEALRTAYKLADKDIMQAPVDYLNSLGSPAPGSITEEQRQKGLALLQPALSGSCGLSALVDCSASQLYVAVAGDSRAVMGTYDPVSKKWKAETLSEDQTGRSDKEVQRIRNEHPKSENDTVIMRGRVLGGLEPTRSFGDGKYKLCVRVKLTSIAKLTVAFYSALGVQEKLVQLFKPASSRTAPPSLYRTPPYVTANPEVTTFTLSAGAAKTVLEQSDKLTNYTPLARATEPRNDASSSPLPASVGRRFVVLATDGLYDCLSSEEVVALVAGHLDGVKGDQSKSELLSTISVANASGGFVSPHKPRGEAAQGKRYCFEDTNICTHLIRYEVSHKATSDVKADCRLP